jgi:succinoglycan biosynthesis protein ExoA
LQEYLEAMYPCVTYISPENSNKQLKMPIEVSIIIPVRDEHDLCINQCLESLERVDYSGSFEIFVIKGGNRAQARNFGIKLAKGRIIVFIDSDCVAPMNWLSLLVEGLKRDKMLGGIGGINLSPADGSLLDEAINFVFSSYLGSTGSASLYTPSKSRFVNALACINSAFWQGALKDAGGFDEEFELCEDTNLSHKVRAAGYNLLLDPKIRVWHHRRDTRKRFAKQFFLYGMGRMRSMLTKREYASTNVTLPFVGTLLFLVVAWFFPLFALVVLAVYLALILIKGFQGAKKAKKDRLLMMIPGLFVIEHLSYFLGMLYGLVKGKWKKEIGHCEVFHHVIITKRQIPSLY